MSLKTHHSLLGVDSNPQFEDIEDAFQRHKLQYPKGKLHADEPARMRFVAIQQVFQTLRDSDARAAYDLKLARAGIMGATPACAADVRPGWFSTRNILASGFIQFTNNSGLTRSNCFLRERVSDITRDVRFRVAEKHLRPLCALANHGSRAD